MPSNSLTLLLGGSTVIVAGLVAFVLLLVRVQSPAVRFWACAALALRLAVGWGIWLAEPSLILTDARGFNREAVELAEVWAGERVYKPSLSSGKEGFTLAIAVLYVTIGVAPLVPLFLNAILGALLVLVVADITRQLYTQRAAATGAAVVALVPSFWWWHSQLLREAPVLLSIAIAANAAIRMVDDGMRPSRAWALGLSVLALFTLRAPIGAVVGVGLVFAVLVFRRRFGSVSPARLAGIASMACVMLVVLPTLPGFQFLAYKTDATSLAYSRNVLESQAQSGFGGQVDVGAQGLVSALPATALAVLTGPLPGQVTGSAQIGLIDTGIWLSAVVLAALGLASTKRKQALTLIIPAGGILFALALTSGNYGTMIRLRAMALVLILPLAVAGARRVIRLVPITGKGAE